MSRLLLGLDGGGSKTRARVASDSGEELGAGEAGPSNPNAVGWASAVAAVLEASRRAREDAGAQALGAPVAVACVGLAGMEREEDRQRMAEALSARGLARCVRVVHDVDLVLAAAGHASGIALICGTGSICRGVDGSGQAIRAGGWGPLLGDEGSGRDLAARALRLATQAADGRSDARALLEAALDHFGARAPEDLLAAVYGPEADGRKLPRFAERALALAEAGDPHARALALEAASDAARMVDAVARRLDLEGPPLAMAGGLLVGSRFYREAVVAAVRVPLGPLALVPDPAAGALALARAG